MTEKIIGLGLFLTILFALLWIAADLAVQPALGEEECKDYSATLSLLERHANAERGAVAELDGADADGFIASLNAREGAPEIHNGDSVTVFVAREAVLLPMLVMPPGSAMAVLFAKGCGTGIVLMTPTALRELGRSGPSDDMI